MTADRSALAFGALLCAVAVGAGAFGAHGLRARLEPGALAQWETAARYLAYAGLGTLAVGLARAHLAGSGARLLDAAAIALPLGGIVFAVAVGGLALGLPRWLGAVAPLGGLGMIIGFVLFAVAAWRG